LARRPFSSVNNHRSTTLGKIGSLQLVKEPPPVTALREFTWHPARAKAKESLVRANGAGESIKVIAGFGAALPPESINH
jgi:hypothetical protein